MTIVLKVSNITISNIEVVMFIFLFMEVVPCLLKMKDILCRIWFQITFKNISTVVRQNS